MGHTADLDSFLLIHKDQLVLSGVSERFWKTLHNKLVNEIFDGGEVFRLIQFLDDDNPHWGLQAIESLNNLNPKHIYLIDHAWTFRLETAKNQLIQISSLRTRLSKMLNLDENLPVNELIEKVYSDIWKLNNTYSITSSENIEDRLPVWYIMDEIGSAVMHSDTPNCRIVPFIFLDEQITYSLLFPSEDIVEDSLIYRDFAEGIVDQTLREAALLPWVPCDFRNINIVPDIPPPEYYLSGHILETMPNLDNIKKNKEPTKTAFKVYAQYNVVHKYLTDDTFEIVNNEEEADILWYTSHFKDFELLSTLPGKFVNQFPFEYVITIKDLFSITCRRSSRTDSFNTIEWLPITYNLKTEIGNFISYYMQRESEGLDNYWIIKPYNLARSMDTHITNNLNAVMRLATTGPKIVQKYVTKPVLFDRLECGGPVKFDLRYVILLKSVKPLEAYIYKNFFLRFANIPFDLSDFQVYEKHFTVMNYNDVSLKHMLCSEFKTRWTEQYENNAWEEIEREIFHMFRVIMETATSLEPPCGIAESPQSRALYAADLILEWGPNFKIQPKILEINWTPDCKRACEYYPNFFNDIFNLLFCNSESDKFIKL